MSTVKLNFGNFQLLANNIITLDSEIRRCLIASNPEGAIIAASAIPQEKENFSRMVNDTNLGTHWIVAGLNSFGRTSAVTSEIEYVTIERKLQRALLFNWELFHTKVAFAIGLTKQGNAGQVYEKVIALLKAIR